VGQICKFLCEETLFKCRDLNAVWKEKCDYLLWKRRKHGYLINEKVNFPVYTKIRESLKREKERLKSKFPVYYASMPLFAELERKIKIYSVIRNRNYSFFVLVS